MNLAPEFFSQADPLKSHQAMRGFVYKTLSTIAPLAMPSVLAWQILSFHCLSQGND